MAEKNKENIKQIIKEKDDAKKNYESKLELIKQRYGIEFNVDYFKDNSINKIKFVNLDYKNKVKNISLIYDNKIKKINYIFYEYDDSSSGKVNDRKLLIELNKEKKLKLAIDEILKLNKEYLLELQNIDKNKNINSKELELKKETKNN